MEFDDVAELLKALDRHGVRYVLIGAMKRGTLRPQDRADAEALRKRFDLEG